MSFGDLYFEDFDRRVKIKHTEGEGFKIYYDTGLTERLIVTLHDLPPSFKDSIEDKFVLEYEYNSDEVLAVLLTTALDLINR